MDALKTCGHSPTFCREYVELQNHLDGTSTRDILHHQEVQSTGCDLHRCTGSLINPLKQASACKIGSQEAILTRARDFVRQYFESIKRLNFPAHEARWTEVETQIQTFGNYEFKEQELTFAARTAWRNAQRCIGRIQWSKLQVFDARFISSPRSMYEALVNHITFATNHGNIRSAVTIFKQRTFPGEDFRIWNSQLIRYAGYRQGNGSIIGDPASVEFTEVCKKLGWKGSGSRFDVLPLVLSANGQDPEWFEIPQDVVLQVSLTHPQFSQFDKLGLKWYAVPLVSGMTLDIGGIIFPACAFSGWYMSTEISRDLCDVNRYNMIEDVASALELDTSKISSLWKDQAFLEVNKAVLYSFQSANVTIVDHHSASESFMKHLECEKKSRGGCPADWVWIVPPLGGSLLPVFHQEMVNYQLSPSYDYQEDAWKTHIWKNCDGGLAMERPKVKRKFQFREIARAVTVLSKFLSHALARRIRATIIYATETGKSERYAKTLQDVFKNGFDAKVISADHYDLTHLEHEALVLVITSTFGNGDPPESGKEFGAYLQELSCPGETIAVKGSPFYTRSSRPKPNGSADGQNSSPQDRSGGPKESPFYGRSSGLKSNALVDVRFSSSLMDTGGRFNNNGNESPVYNRSSLLKPDSTAKMRHSSTPLMETGGPLHNVRFAVFGLGSSSYPHFCAYADYVDQTLHGLGGERVLQLHTGDELSGQDQSFRKWAHDVFKAACDVFCLGDRINMADADAALWTTLIKGRYRMRTVPGADVADLQTGLSRTHHRVVQTAALGDRKRIVGCDPSQQTLIVSLECQSEIGYQPGDHVAVFAQNDPCLVSALLTRLNLVSSPYPVQVEIPAERPVGIGSPKKWKPLGRLPLLPINDIFLSFLDITTPPSQMFLENLATLADDSVEKERLVLLSKNTDEYENWRKINWPTLVEVLDEFPSIEIDPTLLLVALPILQPRFYSISSSPLVKPKGMDATIGLVAYKTKSGSGPLHTGVCSSFINKLAVGDKVLHYVRSAVTFHLPDKITVPIYVIGAGTGIAPFRGFWQHLQTLWNNNQRIRLAVTLIFGCRTTKPAHIYKHEIEELRRIGVIRKFHLALSREPGVPKTYVQNVIPVIGKELVTDIRLREGNVYVCGDVGMASDVYDAIKDACVSGGLTDVQASDLLNHMRKSNRYHEDIFGNYIMTSSGY